MEEQKGESHKQRTGSDITVSSYLSLILKRKGGAVGPPSVPMNVFFMSVWQSGRDVYTVT
ncbi:unnamed protein product [Eretmochelys imbricata]